MVLALLTIYILKLRPKGSNLAINLPQINLPVSSKASFDSINSRHSYDNNSDVNIQNSMMLYNKNKNRPINDNKVNSSRSIELFDKNNFVEISLNN